MLWKIAINKHVNITAEAEALVPHWGYWIDQFSPSMVCLFNLTLLGISRCWCGVQLRHDLHDPSSSVEGSYYVVKGNESGENMPLMPATYCYVSLFIANWKIFCGDNIIVTLNCFAQLNPLFSNEKITRNELA